MEIVCPARLPGVPALIEAIPILANQGATAIELNLNDVGYFDWTEPDEVDKLMSELAESGVRVHSIHSPYGSGYDISNLDDEVHERGVSVLIDSIELASLLGAGKVIVHASHTSPGASLSTGEKPESHNGRCHRARGVLRELSVVARETGIILALENLPPGYLGHRPEELIALMDGCEGGGIGVCFDAGHANLSGDFAEFTRALLPLSVTANLHDNDGAADEHKFPGQGTVDWNLFNDAYRKSGGSASIVLECPPPKDTPWNEAFQRLRSVLGN